MIDVEAKASFDVFGELHNIRSECCDDPITALLQSSVMADTDL